jgi:hypothetical protein
MIKHLRAEKNYKVLEVGILVKPQPMDGRMVDNLMMKI